MKWYVNPDTNEVDTGQRIIYPEPTRKVADKLADTHNEQTETLVKLIATHVDPFDLPKNSPEFKLWENAHRATFPENYPTKTIRRKALEPTVAV